MKTILPNQKFDVGLKSFLKHLFCFILFTFISFTTTAQVTKACWNSPGSANEFTLNKIYLASDLIGTPLSTTACSSSSGTINVYLAVSITNETGSARQGIFLAGDISSGSNTISYSRCFDVSLSNGSPTIAVDPTPFQWTCGEALTMTSPFVGWGSGSGSICGIDCSGIAKSKCRTYGNTIIYTPLVAKFNYTASCPGGTSYQSINLTSTTTGGNNIYTYKWESSTDGVTWTQFSTIQSPTFSPGNSTPYFIKLTVTDSSSPQNVDSEIISNITAAPCCTTPVITNKTTTICSGGTFTITPTNGGNDTVPANTTFSWPAPANSSGISGNVAGTNQNNISGTLTNTNNFALNVIYTVTPKSGACTGTPFTVTVTVNPTLNLGVSSKTDATCYGTSTGSVTAGTVTGAVGTVNYSWKNSSNTVVGTSTTVNNLPAGVYTLTVTDNCSSKTNTVTISQPSSALTATASNQVNVSCKGGNDGSVVITPAGGTATYTITPAQTGLAAGLHTFTVTDAKGCTTTVDVTITEPANALTATASNQVNVSCKGGNDGSVVITPAGGTATYTITPAQTGLAAGLHTFTITDAKGCTTTVDVTITEPANALTATASNQVNVSCKGGNDGSVVITPAGGTATYTITPAQTGLTAGLHTFTVTDTKGCTTTVDVTITEPANALTATASNQVNVSCKGGNDGSVVITPAGGTAGYTITPAQTGLTAGLHTFTVTDAKGCTTTVDVTITEPANALTATASNQVNVSCKGGNDGSVVITPAGGTATYTTTPAQTGLTAGLHTFTVTDAKGCTTTVDVTITEPANALTATASNQVNVSCKGGNDGSVVITPAGGTATYTITPAQT
ncbi:PKD-like domain-containing protein, partial [Flavobacterium flavipallidum]